MQSVPRALIVAAGLVISSATALCQPPAELVKQDRLMAALKELPAKRAVLGNEESRAGLQKTEALLEGKLKDLGYEVKHQEFRWALPARKFGEHQQAEDPKVEDVTFRNLIIEIPGKERPDEVFIVGAHFDAVPGSPGADDNGSGVAALLELACVLKDQPMRRTVRLVFFNLEEVGLVGSGNYVKSLREAGVIGNNAKQPNGKAQASEPVGREKIIGMMSLESIGFFSDEPNSQKSPIPPIKGVFEPPTVGDGITLVGFARDGAFVQKVERGMNAGAPELKVSAFAFPVPAPDLMRSDHAPFYGAGVPSVMLTDTANFRNPNYHKASDTIETIDATRFTQVVKAVAGAVAEVAGAAAPAEK